MALIVSTILFLVFAVNVALGSFASASFLGDVSEMLVLFAAAIFFVVAIIQREAAAKK
jgi:hypothetical protein